MKNWHHAFLVWLLRTFFRDRMVLYNVCVGGPEDGKQSAIQFTPGDMIVDYWFDYRRPASLLIKRRNG